MSEKRTKRTTARLKLAGMISLGQSQTGRYGGLLLLCFPRLSAGPLGLTSPVSFLCKFIFALFISRYPIPFNSISRHFRIQIGNGDTASYRSSMGFCVPRCTLQRSSCRCHWREILAYCRSHLIGHPRLHHLTLHNEHCRSLHCPVRRPTLAGTYCDFLPFVCRSFLQAQSIAGAVVLYTWFSNCFPRDPAKRAVGRLISLISLFDA